MKEGNEWEKLKPYLRMEQEIRITKDRSIHFNNSGNNSRKEANTSQLIYGLSYHETYITIQLYL